MLSFDCHVDALMRMNNEVGGFNFMSKLYIMSGIDVCQIFM